MRPTLVQLRSPHERTPEAYYPTITSDGRALSFNTVRRPNFSRDERFRQYNEKAKITGYMVGPGSYKDNQVAISTQMIPGGPVYGW